MKQLFILLFLIAIIWPAICQELPDGTITTTAYYNEVLKNYNDELQLSFDTASIDIDVTIPVAAYVVCDSNGNSVLNRKLIEQSMGNINVYFRPTGIKFKLIHFEIVGDYNYTNIIELIPAGLIKKHRKAGTINLYFVDSIVQNQSPVYGFTYYPTDSDKNYIFMDNSLFHENNLITQFGHYFGLLPTHDKTVSGGLVNNSDCATTGDLICDTYADPNIYNLVNDTCLYIGFSLDAKNKYYIPSVANFMSNSRAKCKCVFTIQQYRRMFYYYKKFRERSFYKM